VKKPVMIFGQHHAAALYVREHKLAPHEWAIGSHRERVVGLNPHDWETAIVGPSLDQEATEALREWELRRACRTPTSEGVK